MIRLKFADLETKYGNFYVPSFEIKMDGTDLLRAGMGIQRITVDQKLDMADRFSFSFDSPYDTSKDELVWLESSLLRLGGKVEVRMGYGSKLELMIAGEISSIMPSYPAGGIPILEVSGLDLSGQMMKGKRSRSWTDVTDTDIVRLVAGEYGLKTASVDATGVRKGKVVQENQSDYDLIRGMARSNGFEFFVKKDELSFRTPRNGDGEAVTLRWGESLTWFRPEMNLRNQVSSVEVRHWDPKGKEEIVGKAKKGDEHGRAPGGKSGGDIIESLSGGPVTEIVRKPVFSRQEADQMARAILDSLADGLLTGNGKCIGIPEILPGENIRIEGLGKRFSHPEYYVTNAVHTVDGSGYSTTFGVKGNTI